MAYRNNQNTTGSRNRLSDRDMMMDILTSCKYMSSLYDHALLESSNMMVRDLFAELQQDEHESAEMLFQAMQQQGWYNTGANRQNFGKRTGKGRNQNANMQRAQQGMPQTQANSQYAVQSGANNFGRRLSGGKRLSSGAMAGQTKAGLFDARSTWNV